MTYPQQVDAEILAKEVEDNQRNGTEAEDVDLLPSQEKLSAEDQVGFVRKVLGIVAA